MAAVASPDCLLSQPVAGLNSGSHFIGKGEWMLEKGGGFMAVNRTEDVFPANAWHGPQLPAARLQLLGNHILPGFLFLSLSVKCEAW